MTLCCMGRNNVQSVLLVLGLSLFISCAEKPEEPATKDAGPAVEKSYRRGPLSVRILLDKDELSIAETLTLTIQAGIEDGYELNLPSLSEGSGGFGILDYSTTQRLLENGIVASERSFILEPFLSGEYIIPPLEFRFTDAADHTLVTEEIIVQVTSILPEDYEDLELRDIAGPVLAPSRDRRTTILIIAISAVVLLGIAAFATLYLRKRRRTIKEIAVPPHELAYRSLEMLLGEQLVEKGDIKRFYARVSAILREYIENRFGIHAPERTTEEFLVEIRNYTAFSSNQKDILKIFLRHCDLVKFAEHSPTPGDIRTTFDTCKEFVLAEASNAVS